MDSSRQLDLIKAIDLENQRTQELWVFAKLSGSPL